jgi:hypothetical protein
MAIPVVVTIPVAVVPAVVPILLFTSWGERHLQTARRLLAAVVVLEVKLDEELLPADIRITGLLDGPARRRRS